jgi:hypothetical protein
MITSTENRTTIGRVPALYFLLAAPIAMVLSVAPPTSAATPSGKAFAWGDNAYGALGDSTESDVPVAVKILTNVKTIDGGYFFTLAATQ